MQSSTIIVDVRTPEEYADEGCIEKSINIPLDVLESETDIFKNFDNIIVVCRSGKRSAVAKTLLESMGFRNVYNGGAWDLLERTMKDKFL